MKSDIHPQYYNKAKATCACGNTFTVGSTKDSISMEICSACHPFFTGEEKIVDIAGRVEKFKTRRQTAMKKQEKIKVQKAQKKVRSEKREKDKEKTKKA